MCLPFLISISLIPSYAWPDVESLLFFFSVVVISVDGKSKALKILCIGLHTRREEFFHEIVGLYYLRKLTCKTVVKRLILVVQERPRARWD